MRTLSLSAALIAATVLLAAPTAKALTIQSATYNLDGRSNTGVLQQTDNQAFVPGAFNASLAGGQAVISNSSYVQSSGSFAVGANIALAALAAGNDNDFGSFEPTHVFTLDTDGVFSVSLSWIAAQASLGGTMSGGVVLKDVTGGGEIFVYSANAMNTFGNIDGSVTVQATNLNATAALQAGHQYRLSLLGFRALDAQNHAMLGDTEMSFRVDYSVTENGTAVPEPATLAILAAAAPILLRSAKRRTPARA